MRIVNNPEFLQRLKNILQYIANDKPLASINFKNGLKESIKNIADNPYMYPQSNYFNNSDVRDMVYKKYTIVYQVSMARQTIEIMTIFNRNRPIKSL